MLLGLRFQELSWDHTSPEEEEPVLWLEFDGDSEGTPVNKLLRIYSKQVVMWSHTLGLRGQFQVSSGFQTPGGSQVPGKEVAGLPRIGVCLQPACITLVSSAELCGHTPGVASPEGLPMLCTARQLQRA